MITAVSNSSIIYCESHFQDKRQALSLSSKAAQSRQRSLSCPSRKNICTLNNTYIYVRKSKRKNVSF